MPADTANDERNRSALALRIEGLTYRQIADRLGVAVSRAHELVKREAAETLPDDAAVADWRAMQMLRLEALHLAVWDRAVAGDIPSVLTALRIAAAQSRLLGLDRTPEPAPPPGRVNIVVDLT
jgi:orotate phosphoribosyltransferase-like protein